MRAKKETIGAFVIACAITVNALAQHSPVQEAPSTVNAQYVEASATAELRPGEKIGKLFTLNSTTEFILQRLTARTYFFQRQFYGTTFYVGDKGVLLFDPLDGRSEYILQAIKRVSPLPVTAIVYSHDHADHIGDAAKLVETLAKAGAEPRIIASRATASKMEFLGSRHPKPTEIVEWPRGSFKFESLTVELYGFERAAHTDDHGIWLLVGEKVAHLPDAVNPDQPPFWDFAGSENFVYYEGNLRKLRELDWTFLNGGHGNVGSKADVDFTLSFVADLKQAVGKAMGEVPWGAGVEASKVNAHTPYLPAWLDAIAKQATDELRAKYGQLYGFEAATPPNSAMVAMALFSYR